MAVSHVNLTAKSFTDVIAARMDTEQAQLFNILMMTKGNRQYVSNVFGDTNWLPYVTSYYGYRVHPISGEKNYHKAVDIGDAPGHGEILAGHDGVVTQAGEAGSYGLIVVLEGDMGGRKDPYHKIRPLLRAAGICRAGSQTGGDVIAKVGSTGDSTGPHLHLGGVGGWAVP